MPTLLEQFMSSALPAPAKENSNLRNAALLFDTNI
jgi:hypothetical protein